MIDISTPLNHAKTKLDVSGVVVSLLLVSRLEGHSSLPSMRLGIDEEGDIAQSDASNRRCVTIDLEA
jgi:hypothetical protein